MILYARSIDTNITSSDRKFSTRSQNALDHNSMQLATRHTHGRHRHRR